MAPASGKPHRKAAAGVIAIVVLVVIVLVAGVVMVRRAGDVETDAAPDIYLVERGSFEVTVPASGELAALRQTEIASQLERKAVITYIVPEGTHVAKGDLLIKLDDEEIRIQIKDDEVDVKNAETALSTAQNDLQIRKDKGASELSLAEVDIRLAELAMRAWEEGQDVSKRRGLALDVETTKKDYDRLVARFEASGGLLEKEFISQDEYDSDEIAMIRARAAYEEANLAEEVYEKISREQEVEKLRADIKKAKDRRTEIEQRFANEITTLERNVENRQVALVREIERLEKARRQLERCTIIAPQDGLVVYATSLSTGGYGRRGDNNPPQVGTELARNRTVMILPDTSQMVAEVKVNEALSGRIKEGQHVVVYSDAVPDRPVEGEVMGVGVIAESGGWRDPLRRDYTVRIRLLDAEALGLKPSMRCRANIEVGRVDDVLAVPLPAVHRDGRRAYVYTPDGSGFSQREVRTGRASELLIEVREGLADGEAVLLREPPAERITQRLEAEEAAPPAAARRGRPSGGGKPKEAAASAGAAVQGG